MSNVFLTRTVLAFLLVFALNTAFAETAFQYEGIVYKSTSDSTVSVIPDFSQDFSQDYDQYTAVTIPSVVTSGGKSYSVTSIESYSFLFWNNLRSIVIPSSITTIKSAAFMFRSSLKNVTILSSITSIGDSLFYGCSNLTSFTIPSSVTSIGACAFKLCESLTSMEIPSSVTSIGAFAFDNCEELTSIDIPMSVTSIGMYAFWDCRSLTHLEIPPLVTRIEPCVFLGCSSLSSMVIPSSIQSIGLFAFEECTGLNSIDVDTANRYFSSVDGILFNKQVTALIKCPQGKSDSIAIPSSVTLIENYAFNGSVKLASITISPLVTTIGEGAFEGCSNLTSITVPSSVTSIGRYAFYNCTGLSSIYVNWASPLLFGDDESTVFVNVNKTTCTLYVPTGTVGLYEIADQWKDFISIQEYASTAVKQLNDAHPDVFYDPISGSLRLSGTDRQAVVILCAANGVVWLNRTASDGESIPVGTLPKGLYVVKVVAEGRSFTKKMMI